MGLLRVGEIELAYDEAGAGEPVVLLHGFPLNRTMWRAQTEFLQESYRVITPDLRGHGETNVTAEATMELMAEDVAALLDTLQIERAVIGGLSMGGYVTLAFQRRFPERVRALILADTRPQSDTEEARRNRLAQAEQALREGMPSITDALLSKILAGSTLKEQPEIVARVRRMMLGTKPEGTAAALRGMAAREDHSKRLGEIKVPTQIIVGALDGLTPPEVAEAMRREIEGSRLEVIEGAGHLSNMERPAEFNRALKSFLDGLSG